jgi:hypothetical protein
VSRASLGEAEHRKLIEEAIDQADLSGVVSSNGSSAGS